MNKSMVLWCVYIVFLAVTLLAGFGCNGGNSPPSSVIDTVVVWDTVTVYVWPDSVMPIVGWSQHWWKDSVVVGDTLVVRSFNRMMARSVGFWRNNLVFEPDSIGLSNFYNQDTMTVVTKIPFYTYWAPDQHQKRVYIGD